MWQLRLTFGSRLKLKKLFIEILALFALELWNSFWFFLFDSANGHSFRLNVVGSVPFHCIVYVETNIKILPHHFQAVVKDMFVQYCVFLQLFVYDLNSAKIAPSRNFTIRNITTENRATSIGTLRTNSKRF